MDDGCWMTDVFVEIYDLRITIYEVFGVVEEFGPGYVLGFPKLLRCPLRCCWVGELEN